MNTLQHNKKNKMSAQINGLNIALLYFEPRGTV